MRFREIGARHRRVGQSCYTSTELHDKRQVAVVVNGEYMELDSENFTPFFGPPNAAQLARIHALQPAGSEPFAAEDLFVVSLVVVDNLMRRDGLHALSPTSLMAMTKKLPGTTFTRDHDDMSAEKKNARLFDARMTIRADVSDEFIENDGYGLENREILIRQDGYIQVWADLYLLASSPVVEQIRSGAQGEISYRGSFLDARYTCSECNCTNPDGIWGEDCQMLDSSVPWEWFLSEEQLDAARISSFETLEARGFDPYEVSWVTIPAYSRSGTVPKES